MAQGIQQQLQTENTARVGLGLAKALLTPDARTFHLFAFSTAFGVTVWHSLIAGPLSYRELPRQTFGTLQSKLFPSFFGIQTVASSVMLYTLLRDYPIIYKSKFDLLDRTTWQAFTLATSAIFSAVNLLVVGPAATKIMFDRHRQERLEGKEYNDPTASEKLQTLTKEFLSLHSISAALNIGVVGGLLVHGAWLSKFGFSEAGLKRVFK